MEKLCGRLKIELMSDLCAGSGYSYAGIIDSDMSYDAYGIPEIPARRLKGCMREAAQLVCPEAVEALFGKSGDNGVKGIVLGNGYIEDYEEITEELRRLQEGGGAESRYLSPQNILEQYTGIRTQTKLNPETGTAQENSLRYTRVVGQRDPRKAGENLCFYAALEYEKAYEKQVERIVKAVRNLGLHRNRGLGSVRCSLVKAGESAADGNREVVGQGLIVGENVEVTGNQLIIGADIEAGKQETLTCEDINGEQVCLTYIIRNCQSLLMSSDNTGVSDSYISGKSVLGMLAGAYLCREGNTAESKEFQELFLDGTTIFTDANITFSPERKQESADCWPAYYPAPLYLNRLKKTKMLVNLLGEKRTLSAQKTMCLAENTEYSTEDAEYLQLSENAEFSDKAALYDERNGNQPKKLKTHYVHEAAPNTFAIAEADREIVYHNGQLSQLYYLEVISPGQYFRGRIFTDKKYAGLLKELLESARLSFGKSKSAQYGGCELAANITVREAERGDFSVGEGESVAVVFGSDAAFLTENGYTVRYEEVKALVAEKLGIPYDKTAESGSILLTKELTGYHTTWNLRRPGVPGIKAGSVLVYTIASGCSFEKSLRTDGCFVGEGNQEGCGEVRIVKCRDMKYEACQVKPSASAEGVQNRGNASVSAEGVQNRGNALANGEEVQKLVSNRAFLQSILTEQLLERLVFLYMKNEVRLNLNAATVGRVNLMLQESLNAYRHEPEKAFADFCDRVSSIKRVKEKREAFRLLDKLMRKESGSEEQHEIDFDKMVCGGDDAALKEIRELLQKYTTKQEYRERLLSIWGVYLGQIFTWHKYLKKQEGGSGDEEE